MKKVAAVLIAATLAIGIAWAVQKRIAPGYTHVAREELAVGAKAPAFTLVNATDGKQVSWDPSAGRTSVIIFTSNACPYAKSFEDRIVALGRQYGTKNIAFYAINSNDEARNSTESLATMKERAEAKRYPFAYLKDPDSATANAFGARVTPHVFVVDGSGIVRYRGYVDDSAKSEDRTHTGLADALDAMLAGKQVAKPDTKAFGCTIKWKS